MKKFLIALICMVLALPALHAEEPTGRALSMRSKVQTVLQREGYVPSVDNDGELKFKAEGRTYYASFQNYDDGVYIDFYMLMDISDSNMVNLRKAANDAQTSLKFVRVDIVSDSTMSIDVVGYYETVSTFETLLPEMLRIISTARQRVLDNYQE